MIVRTPVVVGLLLLAVGYAGYPCLTLYRVDCALRSGDASTLARLVDWDSVREGLAEQVADDVTDTPSPTAVSAGTQLAPFGHGFMLGIAAHALRRQVTPQHLIAMLRHPDGSGGALGVRLAYFGGWSRFIVRLGTGGDQPDVRLRLDLEHGVWRVTHVRLPARMLREADASGPAVVLAAKSNSG